MSRSESDAETSWTIQLLIRSGRDAELLGGWLPAGWEMINGQTEGGVVADSADLLLADAAELRSHADAIGAAKRDARPHFLPVVALVPAEMSESPLAGVADATDVVDDVVEMPVGKWELRKRVESQLRTRNLSLELASREAQYRGLVELLPEAIVVVRDGLITYANDAGRELFVGPDADIEGLRGRAVTSFVPGEERDRLESLLSAVESAGRVDEFVEVSIERDDGTVRDCEISGVRVSYRDDEATQLVVRDVTERNRQRREIELFRRALDDADQGVTVADARQDDLPLIYANAAFARITGYTMPETLGRNCRFLQGEDTDPGTVAEIRRSLEAEEAVTVEILNYRKDGTPFYNQLEITPVRDDEGEVTHFIGFQTDVTERVEREQRLSEFKAVLQAAGDPIVGIDENGEITTVNEAFTAFVGAPQSAVIGSPIESVLDPADDLVDAIERATDERATRRLDTTVIHTGEEPRFCEVTIAPREEGAGAVIVIRDVTEDRRRRQRVAVLDRLLRHNLRNKMNVVLGRAQSVLDGEGEVTPNIEAVVAAGEELLEMVDQVRRTHDLLDDRTERQSMEMATVVERYLEGVRASYPEVTVEADLTPLTVRAHASIGIGIDQLLENACEHNVGDDQTVRVGLTRDGEWAELVISDDGPGIPEEELAVVSAEAESPLEHSQGVGLWLARWAIEHSGGRIDVSTGDGTTVTVRLPLA